MATSQDRVKEHARVRLMDYWVMVEGEKIQPPLQQDGFCGHFGEVINFALKRALRELNFPWKYDRESDRIELKYCSSIKWAIVREFEVLTKINDIHLDDIVTFSVYGQPSELEDGRYLEFKCYSGETEIVEHEGMNFIVNISVKLV